MTFKQNQEADQASIAFHLALTQIGAATIQDALRLWAGVPPTNTATVAAGWLRRAIQLVMTRRARSRDLAMAYYRLVRALRTGRTIADPRKPEPAYVTLGMLRREFATLAGTPLAGAAAEDEDDRISVEELDGTAREQERLERQAAAEARLDLAALGTDNLENKLKDIDTEAPASTVDALREKAHSDAGTRQASTAARVAMDGARGQIWSLSESDHRVIGYARLSRTGTPCGWCAMLISRGFVRKDGFRSQKSAGPTLSELESGEYADGDKYHDNCNCYAEPVFADEQYSSPRYALNREYAVLWPQVTNGLKGKAALTAWRRFFRDQEQDRAQAARANNTAQEA